MNTVRTPGRQGGAAALVIIALLFFAMLLVVAAANRHVLVEAQTASNQYRSTQAFEAAEAGLEWTLAKLNDDTRLGDDCLPSTADDAASFRDRHLRFDLTLAALVPITWSDAGTPRPLQASCVRGDTGWSCRCPASGVPALPAFSAAETAPAFTVALMPGARPGLVVAVASGCTSSDTLCTASAGRSHEAAARIEVSLGLVSGLRTAPYAALTARGNVDAGAAALELDNPDAASGGAAIDAGGHVAGTALRLSAAPGSALDAAIVSGDAALAGLDGERFFRRWFGMDKAAWRAQPAVARIVCADDCASAVASAVAAGQRLLSVEGDLSLDAPCALGTPEQPVAIVVSGALRLGGAVSVNGLVFAAAVDWHDAVGGGLVRGATLIEGDYSGNAAAAFSHDALVLARLHGGSGSFARIDGSWKDF